MRAISTIGKQAQIKSWLLENGLHVSCMNVTRLLFEYNNNEFPIAQRVELILTTKDPGFIKFVNTVSIGKSLYTPMPIAIKQPPIKKAKCNKAIFPNKKEAEFKINFLNALGVGKKKNKAGLRAYPCGKCKGWHLTSKPINGRKY
jgi:hypothetical protein